MLGKVKCTMEKEGASVHEFRNVTLTYISGEKLAVISRNEKQPREILTLHAARVDVLSSGEIEVNGFLRSRKKNVYRKCRLVFLGNAVRQRSAS